MIFVAVILPKAYLSTLFEYRFTMFYCFALLYLLHVNGYGLTVSQDTKSTLTCGHLKTHTTQLTPGANVHGETNLGCPKVLGFFLKKLQ